MSRPAKLTTEKWIEIGLAALKDHGYEALKADVLAKSQRVTRGSFYHYFQNVTGFHTAVIQRWKEVAAQDVISELDRMPSRRAALEELLRRAFGSHERLERQMRIWAENDPLPRGALAAVDEMRLAYLEKLLTDNGVAVHPAATRANLIYDCYLGCSMRRGLSTEELDDLVAEMMIFCR